MTTHNQLLAKLDRIDAIVSGGLCSVHSPNWRNALARINEVIQSKDEPSPAAESKFCGFTNPIHCNESGCGHIEGMAEPKSNENAHSFKAGELRIDTYRSSGGSDFIHKPDDCVRITHIPTGLVAEAKGERSIHATKQKALNLLEEKFKEHIKMPNYLPNRDPERPAEKQGMFRKFDVRRVDGSDKHHGCRNFVLDMDHDPAAPAAMKAYVSAVRPTHPLLAVQLNDRFKLNVVDPITKHERDLKAVRDAMFGNGHPTDEGVLLFISQEEIETVCRQVVRKLTGA